MEGTAKRKVPISELGALLLRSRYLMKNEHGEVIETPEQMFERVARHVASAEEAYGKTKKEIAKIEETFYNMMADRLFFPNSPTLMNAGAKQGQLSACFVIPIEDSMESIFDALKLMAMIHKSGGGTGFSFSRIRPKGDIVGSTSGIASGPVSFMSIFDTASEVVKQGGKRRGANMGVLRVDHPDIEEFITCKQNEGKFSNFNISVAVTDAFMKALMNDDYYDLVNPRTGKAVRKVKAEEIFNLIAESAWKSGEPGILFIDHINRTHTVPKAGYIETTNPCGEVPLLPYESCNLGSINLATLCDETGEIDYQKLAQVVQYAVRFLDNVIDVNFYPNTAIREASLSNRKIGLGVMGWADLLIMKNIPYDSDRAEELADKIMSFIQEEARKTSAELGKEKGNFPNYKLSIWNNPRMPYMRNATITTIAPTGSISMIAGCSSGIEPIFSVFQTRTLLDGKSFTELNRHFEKKIAELGLDKDLILKRLKEAEGNLQKVKEIPPDIKLLFKSAEDIPYERHVRVQAAFQKYTDNAVSKTINFSSSASIEDIKNAYILAYTLGCKGITVYRNGSRSQQVISNAFQKKTEEIIITPRPRPDITEGTTSRVNTGCGKLYVTVNKDNYGVCEVFAHIGKAGGCAYAQTEALGRLVSLALRAGIAVEVIAKQLIGIRCPSPAWNNGASILSCADAVGKILALYTSCGRLTQAEDAGIRVCRECGGQMNAQEGCFVCQSCGFSLCS
ncbi:MAG: vitamin B12-dependent ribonucleotide reductase [Candidatus Methanomethylicaceae archaeon]